MTISGDGRTLGMEGNEIERRAALGAREISAAQAMLQELAREGATAAGGIPAAPPFRRQRAFHAVDGVVVQFEEFVRFAAPIADVGLVPDLPIPGFHLGAAMFFDAMLRPLENQFFPFGVIL